MRLKDFSILSPRYNGPKSDSLVAFVPMEGLRTDSIEQQEISIEEGSAKYTYFADNDLLIAKVTPCFENGNIAVAKDLKGGIGFGSSEIFVLRFSKGYSPRYMYYVAMSSQFQDQACATMCGVGGLKRISPLIMRTYNFKVPTKFEQDKIVAYLDNQLEQINKRICLRERELQTLIELKQSEINSVVTCGLNSSAPFKDSGVDWIGDIPTHWEIRRIKDIFKVVSGNGFKVELQGNEIGDYPFCKASDLNGDGIYVDSAKNWVSDIVAKQEHYNIIKPNSILFPKIGESLKKNHRKINRVPCIVDNNCAALVNYTKNNTLYFYYVSTLINMGDFNNGGAVPSVDMSSLLSFSIPFPPLNEQEQIVLHIQNKIEAIDKIISNINAQIDKLKLLKKSLINEVISGQRPVI